MSAKTKKGRSGRDSAGLKDPSLPKVILGMVQRDYGPNMKIKNISLLCLISSILDDENKSIYPLKARYVYFPHDIMRSWLKHTNLSFGKIGICTKPILCLSVRATFQFSKKEGKALTSYPMTIYS